jgi:general secretion pathway protein I
MHGRRERGFTLIEVLVATTIAALLLFPLLRSFSAGLATTQRLGGITAATLLAESTLETVGSATPLVDGSDIDRQQGPYHLTASVRRYSNPSAAGGDQAPPVVPYEITVAVDWRDASGPQSVSLRSLRLGLPSATSRPLSTESAP